MSIEPRLVAAKMKDGNTGQPYLDELKVWKFGAAAKTGERFRDANIGQGDAIRNVDDTS